MHFSLNVDLLLVLSIKSNQVIVLFFKIFEFVFQYVSISRHHVLLTPKFEIILVNFSFIKYVTFNQMMLKKLHTFLFII